MRRLAALAVAALALAPAAGARAAGSLGEFDLPVWSPDGTRIAFAYEPFGGGPAAAQIWTANADGSGARPLIGGLRNGLFQIAWPEADTILYDANFSVRETSVAERTHRSILPAQGSTFTADARGDRVASTCDRCNGPVVVVDVATGKRIRFGGGDADVDSFPALSPDGTRIAFQHSTFDPATDDYTSDGLWVARSDGAARRRIARRGYCASWSPTGGEIAFEILGSKGLSLWEVGPGGTRERLLLQRGPVCSVPASFAWSPDGRSIAYVHGRRGRLAILDVASRRVTPVPAFGSVIGIAWSPDSKRLLVAARPHPTTCSSLWEVGADGKDAVPIRSCR